MHSPRSLLRGHAFLLPLALLTALLALPLTAQTDNPPAEPQSLGLREPTLEEQQRLRVLAPRVEKVLPNSAALKLANAERFVLGLAPLALPVVPDGSELIFAPTTAAASAPALDVPPPSTAAAEAAIPSAADNGTSNFFPPIRNQGSIGSCATFAAGYYMAGYMRAKARGLNIKHERNDDKISPKFLYAFVNGGADSGSWFTDIFDVLLRHGAPTWEVWPYSGVKTASSYLEWPTTTAVYRDAIGNRMESVYTLTDIDTTAGLDRLKTTLANGAVVVFATNVNGFQYATISDDPATPLDNAFVGRPIVKAARVNASGHAMTIVGYNDNLWVDLNKNGQVDPGEKGALRIANSWGTSWQDGGFVWLSYDALRVTSAVADVGPDVSQYRAGGGIAPPSSSGGTAGPVSGGAANPLQKPIWDSTVYGITAKAAYNPQVLAQFRLSDLAARNILRVSAGRGAITSTVPATEVVAPAVDQSGGALPVPGIGPATGAATFLLDLTDLVQNGANRYFIKVTDTSRTTLRYLTNGAGKNFDTFVLVDGTGQPLTSTSYDSAVVSDTVAVYSFPLTRSAGAPAITSALTKSGIVNAQFVYKIEASNLPTSFSVQNLPPGLDATTVTTDGVLSGRPTSAGTFSVPITATNALGTDTKTLVVTILPALPIPVISSAPTASGTRGSAFTYQMTASNSPTSYSVSGTLPNGLALNTATGLISGTPAASGVFNLQVGATNGGDPGTRSLVLTIATPTAVVPVIASATTATVAADAPFTYRITANNTPTTYGALNLPEGLAINAATGAITGRISLARSYQITLTATNAVGIGYATLTLDVTGNSSFGPSNDAWGSAIALSGSSVTTTGANVNATAEASEPAHAGSPAAKSVWWSWTAPSSGTLTLGTTGSVPAMRSALYTGASVSTLTAVAPAAPGTFAVVAGTVYRIAVDSIDNQTGSIALSLSLSAPAPSRPTNDNFAAATVLTGSSANATNFTTMATAEIGEPAHGETPAAKTVWFSWTAPAAGRCTVSLSGSNFDTLLSIYTGTALNALTVVVRDDDSGTNGTSEASFAAVAGTTYRIAVDGYGGDSGELKLSLALTAGATGPANDSFAAASVLSGPIVSTSGSSANATRETGEPAHAALPATRSVWFRWVAPAAGPVTVSTAGSTFDTLLAVYSGSTLAGLTAIASNDDAGTQATSLLTFNAISGTTYSIAVDGYDGASGNYALSLTLASTTADNNAFAAAAILASGVRTTALSTLATAETAEPAHFTGNPARKSLWWRWTPATTGFVSIGTAGSTFDTVLAVYTGSYLAALTKIAENDDATSDDNTSNVFFRAIAGRTYFIAVDGFGGASGTVSLIVTPSADANTVYATDFERFTVGTGQLVNQDQWIQIGAPASGNAQGILAQGFAGQGRAGYLGYGSPTFENSTDTNVFVYRPLNFDPVAEGAPIVQVRADINIIASTNGRNDVFRLSLYNRDGVLLGGFFFNTATRLVSTSDGASLKVSTFTFATNTRYTLLGTFNFATRRWSARINSTELIADSPFGNGAASFDVGDFDFVWRIADAQRQPGDNFILFDNLAITATAVPTAAPALQLPSVPPVGSLGTPVSYAVTATGPITAYSASGLPAGLTLNAITGLISGTPTQTGTFTATFTATNASGQSTTSSTTFTIAAGPPVINSAASVTAGLNQPFSFQLTATNAPRGFGLRGTAALPSGLTLNPTTGMISGTPRSLGSYRLTVAAENAVGSGSATLDLKVDNLDTGRLINLSVLTEIASPGDTFTLGYVVGGSGTNGPKPLVIRAAGPSLGAFGVPGTLDDPKLETFAGSTKTGENDNWGGSAQLTAALANVGAFAYSGPASKDAAVSTSITTRDNSVAVSGVGSLTGKVIAEVYDATGASSFSPTTPRLINVSVRKHLGTGLTAGFVLGGSTTTRVLIRVVGPGLAVFGVPATVVDPQLTLFAGSTKIGENNDWAGTAELTAAFASVGAFGLPGATSKDAALLVSLPPGQYSVQATGVANTTGVALVEVYEVP